MYLSNLFTQVLLQMSPSKWRLPWSLFSILYSLSMLLFPTNHLALADMICLLSLSMLIEVMLHAIRLWDKSYNFNSITQKKIIFLSVESLNVQGCREERLGICPKQSFRNKDWHFDLWLSRTSWHLHKVIRQWKRVDGMWATCMSHVEKSTHHCLSQYIC